jgi:hypothetical protein
MAGGCLLCDGLHYRILIRANHCEANRARAILTLHCHFKRCNRKGIHRHRIFRGNVTYNPTDIRSLSNSVTSGESPVLMGHGNAMAPVEGDFES